MSKLEATSNQPVEANNSAGVGDVIGEFASSAWKAGVVRPFVGVAQLAGADVHMTPEKELTGVMRGAQMAGNAAGTLADLVFLSRYVGKGVGALGEATQAKSLIAENSLARSLTTSGATGFTDGFAFNPTQPGEGISNRLAHGVAEGAGFMALDGTARLLGRLPEGAITKPISGAAADVTSRISAYTPAWLNDMGRTAAESVGRDAKRVGELVSTRFPSLTAENMTRNAIAGFVGGDVYYSAEIGLNGKRPDILDGESTALGWAAANALLGGKLGTARSAETAKDGKLDLRSPSHLDDSLSKPGSPVKPEPPPSYKPDFKTLENGDQQWTYRDVPNKGDETVYTKGSTLVDGHKPSFDWQIKTADGKVYDRNTRGPWEINYPDGSSLIKNDVNYLSFTKPVSIEVGGKPLSVNEVTQLHADHSPIAKQWVYEDPAVPGQTVTFNADRTWEAIGADGKYFNYRSPGPWKVTNLDGYVETLAPGKDAAGKDFEIDVNILPGLSTWRNFAGKPEGEPQPEPGKPRKPMAFSLSATDNSPMSLSDLPRRIDMERTASF